MHLLLHPLLLKKPLHILLLGCFGFAVARQVTIMVVKVTIETVTVRNFSKNHCSFDGQRLDAVLTSEFMCPMRSLEDEEMIKQDNSIHKLVYKEDLPRSYGIRLVIEGNNAEKELGDNKGTTGANCYSADGVDGSARIALNDSLLSIPK